MFEQSLVETTSEGRRRKGWTAIASYVVEAIAIGVLIAMPLFYSEALPLNDHPIFHPPTRYGPDNVRIVSTEHMPRVDRVQPAINRLYAPQSIPNRIDRTSDPVSTGRTIPGDEISGAITDGNPDGVQNSILASVMRNAAVPPPLHAVAAPVIRTSRAQESLLIRQIKPTYPPLAVSTRTQGTVMMQAMISRDGSIESLEVLSGHPLLVKAAVDAVKQWRYRPFLLNGEPMEVQTRITVNFTLSGNP
jgi:periplasmic protein TonB